MAHTLKESLEARVREAERRGLGRRAPVLDRTDVGPLVMSGGRIFISYMSNDYIGLSQDRGWRRDVADCFAAWPPSGSASRLAGGLNSITKEANRPARSISATTNASFCRAATRQTWPS